ncbi:unnamed protein product [Lactuca virosa]|uniref:Maturase n=1 Tax=Lactuca virosa TaxID=75947 RepID=A0AAU9PSB0_9ASTR|nr:unnamed protein product [Lactuca virosa]
MRDFFKYCKRKGLLIELGGEAILVIRSERGLARKLAPLKSHYLIRICYARYADDLLLGIVGAIELLIEIKKLLAHFLQSGLNLWVGSVGSTTIVARSTVEFLGTVIREVPSRTTPIQFLRELEKRLRVKHHIHITACHLRSAIHSKFRNLGNSIPIKELTKGMSGTGSLLDVVQLADTLGTAGCERYEVSRVKEEGSGFDRAESFVNRVAERGWSTASTTGVSSASLVASSLMTDSSIESSSLSQATALPSYTTASGSLSFVHPETIVARFSFFKWEGFPDRALLLFFL